MAFRALLAFLAAAFLAAMPVSAEVVLNRGNAGGEPFSLDPANTQGTWENNIVGDMLEGLTTEDVDGKIVPAAAESWDISADGRTWTFHIRPNALWSDGTPVTADDFVYSWRRLMDPKTAAQYASILYVVKNAERVNKGELPLEQLGIAAPDPKTFVVTLEHPAPYLDGITAHQATFPVPRWQIEKFGADWIKASNFVSNGPYKLVEWRVNEYVRLGKSPTYYDAAHVQIDTVNWIPNNNFAAGVKSFRAGEYDLYDSFPNNQYKALKAQLGDEVKAAPYLATGYLIFNRRRKPFDDIRVRMALSLAIDRKVITENIYQLGEPVACALVPPETANYERGAVSPDCRIQTQHERNERAKELLKEAGFGPDNPLKFTYNTTTDPDSRRASAAVQAMWKTVGVEAEIEGSEPATHYNQHLQTYNFDVASAAWVGDYNDPETFLFMFETNNAGFNYGGYSNPRYDELMRQERQEPDVKKRASIMREAEQLLLDEYGVAPTRFRFNPYLVHSYVKGWTGNMRGVNRSRWMSIEGPRTIAKPAAADQSAAAAENQDSGGERPWYWWLVAAWEWLKGLLCSWFGVACPAV
ncbi:MAG: peptide ABC transporter substrate-binding protein [Alphaproteobacteria bacterium]|nr:peptide ABC transporter substrate-binding protein [Alphaproteobacteria bacterium]